MTLTTSNVLPTATRRTAWLWSELAVLYALYPAAVVVGAMEVDDRWVVWGFTSAYIAIVLFARRPTRQSLGVPTLSPLARVALSGLVLLGLLVLSSYAGKVTGPGEARRLVLVFGVYPVVSVPAQEFYFRSFFFMRYRELLKPLPLAGVNAMTFSFYHALFGGWMSIIASLAGGAVLSLLYVRFRNVLVCAVVHFLLGLLAYFSGNAHLFTRLKLF